MVPQCYILLFPCVYGLQQYGHLINSCPLCFLFCSVSCFKIDKNSCYCCFQLGLLYDYQYRKELFIRFTMRVFRERLSVFVRPSFPSGFEGGVWDLIVLIPDHYLSI